MKAAQRVILPVRDIFPTLQGEGPYTGRACVFVRLGHCNLHCPDCDTKDTWDTSVYDLAETCPDQGWQEILANAREAQGGGMLVITGGEPLIWQRTAAWRQLLGSWQMWDGPVHVETNGTIPPDTFDGFGADHYTVSPKLTAMGAADPYKRRIRPAALAAFNTLADQGRACFKFVCGDADDVEEVVQLCATHHIAPQHVWVMPLDEPGRPWTERAPEIAAAALGAGFNTSGRLHTLWEVK